MNSSLGYPCGFLKNRLGRNIFLRSFALFDLEKTNFRLESDVQVDGRNLTEIINEKHENVRYMPGVTLPDNVVA
jgi:glycerol-3-phosphate dehydrogenase (NAD+)